MRLDAISNITDSHPECGLGDPFESFSEVNAALLVLVESCMEESCGESADKRLELVAEHGGDFQRLRHPKEVLARWGFRL